MDHGNPRTLKNSDETALLSPDSLVWGSDGLMHFPAIGK